MARTMSSGELTATAQAITGPCVLHGILLISNAANDPKVILHSNTSAAGTVIGEYTFDVSAKGSFVEYFPVPEMVCYEGVYATISGTGASFVLYYEGTGELPS